MKGNLKILILGTPRSGRRSLLASMLSSITKLEGNPISVKFPERETMDYMTLKNKELESYFIFNVAGNVKCNSYDSNIGAGNILEYKSDITVAGHLKVHSSFILTDFPTDISVGNEYFARLKSIVKSVDAVFVAVDSPRLVMDETIADGSMLQILDKNIFDYDSMAGKLMIFIPMKCERYFYLNRISDVNDKIKEKFYDMIYFWQKRQQGRVLIMPALTLGGLAFERFENGLDYYSYVRGDREGYSPQFCEQPLLYVLNELIGKLPWYELYEKKGNFKQKCRGFLSALDDFLSL